MRRLLALVNAALLGGTALPAAAHATLVYDKNDTSTHPSVFVAHDDGSAPRRLGAGQSPDLSPDGSTVVWAGAARPTLVVSPTASAAPRTLLRDFRGSGVLDWSPDSRSVATVAGPEIKAKRLVVVDVATGAQKVVATGFFGGVSFAPAGDALVYARGAKDDFRYDLYRYDVAAGTTTALTADHRAGTPLWGPRSIVFTRLVDASVRRYGPKGELYTIRPDGRGLRRLTHQKVGALLFGLTPTQFSGDGTRLLAQFGGQDTSYAQVVDPATGRVRTLGRAQELGYEGYALSRDGRTVLAATGGFDPGSRHDIVTVPYAGGPARVLVRYAFVADWDR
jgi:Tol biopolymer transport system component